MITGFYSCAAGMLGQIDKQDAIANNLANCNSPGFKRSTVGLFAFATELASATSRNAGCTIPETFASRDQRQGQLEETGGPTDLAIDGPGSFVVRTPRGEQLTRAGNFRLDALGELVTPQGAKVLGERGPIQISSNKWSVDEDGNVTVDGSVVDKLRIELGSGSGRGNAPGRVVQGRLESSNVSAVQEMVAMITAMRAYEANQRAIQALDQTLDKIINQAARS